MTLDAPTLLEAVLLAALESPCGITGALARARTLTPAPLLALDHDETVRHALARYLREHWIQVLPSPGAPRYHLTGLGEQRLLWHRQRGTLKAPRDRDGHGRAVPPAVLQPRAQRAVAAADRLDATA